MGLGAAILSLAVYVVRVESRANDAHTRVLEMRTEISDLRNTLTNQQTLLARVEADSRAILRTLKQIQERQK